MRIKESAILLRDGRIFTGKRHCNALEAAKQAGVERLDCLHSEQGFMTECGKFVRRKLALRIALDANQVLDHAKIKWHVGLFSEDLY